jgi:hypothetical protein
LNTSLGLWESLCPFVTMSSNRLLITGRAADIHVANVPSVAGNSRNSLPTAARSRRRASIGMSPRCFLSSMHHSRTSSAAVTSLILSVCASDRAAARRPNARTGRLQCTSASPLRASRRPRLRLRTTASA